MTRVDFYLTGEASDTDKDIAVCKLTHKAFRLGHEVYILTASPEESSQLDRLLWTFSAGSFIPHALNTGQARHECPILIGEQQPPESWQDVLISLTITVPECFSHFRRVVEIVGPTAEGKQRARERYRFYRERGYPLQTHNL
jgi:DNA polymerase-3 subunit chi